MLLKLVSCPSIGKIFGTPFQFLNFTNLNTMHPIMSLVVSNTKFSQIINMVENSSLKRFTPFKLRMEKLSIEMRLTDSDNHYLSSLDKISNGKWHAKDILIVRYQFRVLYFASLKYFHSLQILYLKNVVISESIIRDIYPKLFSNLLVLAHQLSMWRKKIVK